MVEYLLIDEEGLILSRLYNVHVLSRLLYRSP
jgi:hypothetical protein